MLIKNALVLTEAFRFEKLSVSIQNGIIEDIYAPSSDEERAKEAILSKVNEVCFKILECTAVFKNTQEGQAAFDRFMRTLITGEPPVIEKKLMPADAPKRGRGRPPKYTLSVKK